MSYNFWLLAGTYYKKSGNLIFFRGEFGPFFSEKKKKKTFVKVEIRFFMLEK
jgi:hypothetical protein